MLFGNHEELSVGKGFGGWSLIKFILGSLFGGTVGVFVMCLCQAAGKSDNQLNYTDFDE